MCVCVCVCTPFNVFWVGGGWGGCPFCLLLFLNFQVWILNHKYMHRTISLITEPFFSKWQQHQYIQYKTLPPSFRFDVKNVSKYRKSAQLLNGTLLKQFSLSCILGRTKKGRVLATIIYKYMPVMMITCRKKENNKWMHLR